MQLVAAPSSCLKRSLSQLVPARCSCLAREYNSVGAELLEDSEDSK